MNEELAGSNIRGGQPEGRPCRGTVREARQGSAGDAGEGTRRQAAEGCEGEAVWTPVASPY